jgi:two-component system NarL family response regulator
MELSEPMKILIADDHPFFIDGLVANLETESDMKVVARAANGEQAVKLSREYRPDVILMDLRMPVMNGVEAICEILAEDPSGRIIVLTTYDGDEDIHRALKCGAKAYLLKDVFREELLKAIRDVYAGRRYISPEVAGRLAERWATEDLTGREVEVLRLIAGGKTNREIGEALMIAEGTVKAHVNNILNKLNANDRTHAAMLALQRGILHLD